MLGAGWTGVGWTGVGCIAAEGDSSGVDDGAELGTDVLIEDWRASTTSVSEATVAFISEIVSVCFLSKRCG